MAVFGYNGIAGKSKEVLALPASGEAMKHRITYHPHSTPLHKVCKNGLTGLTS